MRRFATFAPLVSGRLASCGIALCASISLRELFGIEVLSRSPGPTKILGSGGKWERKLGMRCRFYENSVENVLVVVVVPGRLFLEYVLRVLLSHCLGLGWSSQFVFGHSQDFVDAYVAMGEDSVDLFIGSHPDTVVVEGRMIFWAVVIKLSFRFVETSGFYGVWFDSNARHSFGHGHLTSTYLTLKRGFPFSECFFQSFSYAQAAQESQFHAQEQAIILNSIEGILIQEYIIELANFSAC
ncbi:hypothetical protein WN51_05260 [Melipona quadrifasciata]|uniref:Uncharacterized protein n=1 Tax=Melipona quadrifasciata TaxID=166423 RepID=A0A0M8ZVW8_9HYME|nr:hypothetical protein WN51_05260 [Melipona quadrifasciata]